jgi:hypothetical protein
MEVGDPGIFGIGALDARQKGRGRRGKQIEAMIAVGDRMNGR